MVLVEEAAAAHLVLVAAAAAVLGFLVKAQVAQAVLHTMGVGPTLPVEALGEIKEIQLSMAVFMAAVLVLEIQ
jgi:hypothetical protein